MGRKKKFPISHDDMTISLPFPLDELENYLRLDVANMTLEGEDLIYFLIRATNTAKQVKELRQAVDAEIKRRSILASQRQVASIDPLEAAKYLTKEQQLKLLDSISQDQMRYIERQKAKWELFSNNLSHLQDAINSNDLATAQKIINYLAGKDE